MKKALVHRYDNKRDILAVEDNQCSEVYSRSKEDDFDLVIVVPTKAANTGLCVIADAKGKQYEPENPKPWPGKPDAYPVRIDVENVRFSNVRKVRLALEQAGKSWAAAWTILSVEVDEFLLF